MQSVLVGYFDPVDTTLSMEQLAKLAKVLAPGASLPLPLFFFFIHRLDVPSDMHHQHTPHMLHTSCIQIPNINPNQNENTKITHTTNGRG